MSGKLVSDDVIVAVQIKEVTRAEYNNSNAYNNDNSIMLRREDSERIGCDVCKGYSTEKFIGYCGSVLWLCEMCEDLIAKRDFVELAKWKDRFHPNKEDRA